MCCCDEDLSGLLARFSDRVDSFRFDRLLLLTARLVLLSLEEAEDGAGDAWVMLLRDDDETVVAVGKGCTAVWVWLFECLSLLLDGIVGMANCDSFFDCALAEWSRVESVECFMP
jgi:hypothetical protein